jgi:hypothetical protein
MNDIQQIRQMLASCSKSERREVFEHLRNEFGIHPLEQTLHARAEVILEAIHRAGELTRRMIRGVIAGAAFDVEVADRLTGWSKLPLAGDPPYDCHLRDQSGEVKVQVKLQRSKGGQPMMGGSAGKANSFADTLYVVETQKTRAGTKKTTGSSTRPYRFGEFDILAVAMYPSTQR